MKKILATVLLVTYFAFSSGVVINYHFCMNELASAKLFHQDSEVCGECGMHNDNNGCCHDEVIVMKAKDDHSLSALPALEIKAPDIAILPVSEHIFLPLRNHPGNIHAAAPDPPLISGQETYLQNCVFRI